MSTHRGRTDQTHRVSLPSAIERVRWAQLRAAPGGTVGLDVRTRYVGDGAPLQIVLADREGQTYGTFQDQIHDDRLTAQVQVPSAATGALFAEVTFPEHGLSQTSPPLVLARPVVLKRATWSADGARRGDVLTLSAEVRGAPDGTEATVRVGAWDAAGAHDPITRFSTRVEDERVEVSWAVEPPDDTERIPTETEADGGYKPPKYVFQVEVDGVEIESDPLPFRDRVAVQGCGPFGTPLAETRYVLHLPDGSAREGTLDDEGRATEADVPPGPCTIEFPKV